MSDAVQIFTARRGEPDRIPVRFWPNPSTMYLGHMTVTPHRVDENTVAYDLAFVAGPLHGEPPRFDIRFDADGGVRFGADGGVRFDADGGGDGDRSPE
ncbi:hypothetical protein ACWESM_18645 [Nocardia sp. NPDC003999]